MVQALGIGASLTGMAMALAPLLQMRLILGRKHSDDVSVGFLGVIVAGVLMWAIYGLAKQDLFLIIPNTVAVFTNGATALCALKFRSH